MAGYVQCKVSAFGSWIGRGAKWIWDWMQGRHVRQQVLVVGLDNGGKTTILYRLGDRQNRPHTYPSCGWEPFEKGRYKNLDLVSRDLGGSERVQRRLVPLLAKTYKACAGLVYVIDGHDRERLSDAKRALEVEVLPHIGTVPTVVLVNKQDLPGAMTPEEVRQGLGFGKPGEKGVLNTGRWWIQACSALKNVGVKEGFDWMVEAVTDI